MFSSSSSLVSGLLRPLWSSASTCRRAEASGLNQSCTVGRPLATFLTPLTVVFLRDSPSFPLSTSQNTKEIKLRTNDILRLLHEAKELQWNKMISPIQIYIPWWLAFLCISLSYYLAIFRINSDGSLRRLYAARPKAAEKRFVLQPMSNSQHLSSSLQLC